MKKIIWVFLAVAICACSENSKKSTKTENEYTSKSNTEQQTAVKQESITMHERMLADGWTGLGIIESVYEYGNYATSYFLYFQYDHYAVISTSLLDTDESNITSTLYGPKKVEKGSFRIHDEYYTGRIPVVDSYDYHYIKL